MPLYRCAVLDGTTNEAQRGAIAQEIVRIHCEVTGAPPSFVHAFFTEAAASEFPDGKRAFVLGSIRWGRTDEQKAEIVARVGRSVARILDCDRQAVDVVTADVPSRWNMEGGELLPEPGEEREWLARHGS